MRLRIFYDILMNVIRFPFLTLKKNTYSILTCSLGGWNFRGCNIGDNVYIGNNSSAAFTDIGPFTCIASNVVIGGMEHAYWFYSINPRLNPHVRFGQRTRIGCDVWIGANVVIRQGVTIGDGAIIGAGSVVTHDIPENSIAYGVPARIVKPRMSQEQWQQVRLSHYYECRLAEAKKIISSLQLETSLGAISEKNDNKENSISF